MPSGEIEHNRLYFSYTWCIMVRRETSWCWMFVFNRYLFTTIHDKSFRPHSSIYVTIHVGNFRQLYNISTSTPGSWHALRPGSQRVRAVLLAVVHISLIQAPFYRTGFGTRHYNVAQYPYIDVICPNAI